MPAKLSRSMCLINSEMCDTRLAFLMHAQRPGPTHVRILNDLPVDCTSVSLTASVCVSPHTRTRPSSKTTKRLSRANRMPEPLYRQSFVYQQPSSAGESSGASEGCMQISIMLASNRTAILPSRCGRVELCPAESQSLRACLFVSQRYKEPASRAEVVL